MKKTVLNLAIIITIVIVYAPYFTLIWTVVSFILYLVKDIPFAWWSIIAYLVSKFIKVFLFLSTNRIPSYQKSSLEKRIDELKRKTENN